MYATVEDGFCVAIIHDVDGVCGRVFLDRPNVIRLYAIVQRGALHRWGKGGF